MEYFSYLRDNNLFCNDKEHTDVVRLLHRCDFGGRLSVDVVPDISVHDEHTFRHQLEEELKTVLPDMNITIVIDHNYSNEVI